MILAEVRFLIKSPAYEVLFIGAGQAGSGSKEDGTEILTPWMKKGNRGMQGTSEEQAEQVAYLKRPP